MAEPTPSNAVTLRDLVDENAQRRIKALQWAKGFSEVASVDGLLEGVVAFEAFFASPGGTNEAKETALSAAILIALRQPDSVQPVWASVARDAARILAHLTAPSSTPPAPGAAGAPRLGAEIEALWASMQEAQIELNPPSLRSVADEVVRAAGFSLQPPADEGPGLPAGETPPIPRPPHFPECGARAHLRTDGPSPKCPSPPSRGEQR